MLLSGVIICDDSQRVVLRRGFFSVHSLSRQNVLVGRLGSSLGRGHCSWVELKEISILPQFVPGWDNVVANALSRPNQMIWAEWTLHQIFYWLRKRWPVTIDLFASSLIHRCGVRSLGCGYGCHALVMEFSPDIRFSSICLDSSGSGEAEVVGGHSSYSDCAVLAAEGAVSGSSRSPSGAPSTSFRQVGSAAPAALSEVPPKPPRTLASCLAAI